MVTLRKRNTQLVRLSLIVVLTAFTPSFALAGDGSDTIPANAHVEEYGAGWECSRGYHRDGNTCVLLKVPENAHLDYSGGDWECNRPYQRRQGESVLLQGLLSIKLDE